MRIAIFSDTFPPQATNGVANVAFQSAKTLAALGHTVMVFTVSKNFLTKQLPTDAKNLTIVSLPSVPALVYLNERFHIPFSASLRRLKKFNPDIIHAHTPFGIGRLGTRGAKILRKPLVGTHHTFYDHYLKHVKADYSWAKKLSWKIIVNYYNRCDMVLSPTRSLADSLSSQGLKKPAAIIQNSIDTDLFRPAPDTETRVEIKKSFGIPGKSIVYMGRLSYEKSIEQVVQAFAFMLKKNPRLKLMLIGDGPERKKLEKLAEKLSIKNSIIFTGFLYGEKLVKALWANDIFLTASKSENMPLSVLEAMAAGLPIVAVKEKGLGEIVKVGANGFFAQTDCPEDMSEKTLRLLSDSELLKKFSATSRALALEYSHQKVALALEGLYNQTINHKK